MKVCRSGLSCTAWRMPTDPLRLQGAFMCISPGCILPGALGALGAPLWSMLLHASAGTCQWPELVICLVQSEKSVPNFVLLSTLEKGASDQVEPVKVWSSPALHSSSTQLPRAPQRLHMYLPRVRPPWSAGCHGRVCLGQPFQHLPLPLLAPLSSILTTFSYNFSTNTTLFYVENTKKLNGT